MSLILIVFIPICCAIAGKLLGVSLAASFFFSEHGRRIGKLVSRWCVPIFPFVYLVLLCVGGSGNAGTGMRLFGSETLFGLVCGMPFFAIPVLAAFAGAMYVVRDLTLGHQIRVRHTEFAAVGHAGRRQ